MLINSLSRCSLELELKWSTSGTRDHSCVAAMTTRTEQTHGVAAGESVAFFSLFTHTHTHTQNAIPRDPRLIWEVEGLTRSVCSFWTIGISEIIRGCMKCCDGEDNCDACMVSTCAGTCASGFLTCLGGCVTCGGCCKGLCECGLGIGSWGFGGAEFKLQATCSKWGHGVASGGYSRRGQLERINMSIVIAWECSRETCDSCFGAILGGQLRSCIPSRFAV